MVVHLLWLFVTLCNTFTTNFVMRQQFYCNFSARRHILCIPFENMIKIGQMTQEDASLRDKADAQKYYIGSILSGGDADPSGNLPHPRRHIGFGLTS